MADDIYRSYRATPPFPRDNSRAEPDAGEARSDPLTELARLLGQNDPFGEPVHPRHDATGPDFARPSADRAPQYDDDAAPASDHYHDRGHADDPHDPQHDPYAASFGPLRDPQRDDERQDPPYYGSDGQPEGYFDAAYPDEEPPPRRRGRKLAVAAVLGIAVIGTAGAYAYRTVLRSNAPAPPPVIKADATPNKIVPPTSSEASNSKQIYDRVGDQSQGEKLVSREEQPLDPKAAGLRPAATGSVTNPTAEVVSPPARAAPANSGWPAPATSPAAAVSAATPTPAAPTGGEPRKVRTVVIRPDQASAAPKPAAASETAAPSPTRSPSTRSASANGPLSLDPQGARNEPVANVVPRAAAAAAAAAAPARVSASSGSYVVQLSAQKSQEEAAASFRSTQAKYPNVLGGRQMLIRKKELPDKGTFYGVQVGPFAAREEAMKLCETLKSAGGNCIVQRN